MDDGRYQPMREVARGGMGKIQSARDLRLDRTVALKQLLDHDDDYYRARFEREALITARLQHPAIVPVYDAGRLGSGEPFYCMKLVSGTPLDKVVDGARTLEQRLALLPKLIAVAEAIAYAHSEGIIHRDLKPANILVGSFGETVVIDWGLAKDLRAEDDLLATRPARRAPTPAPVTRTGSGSGSGRSNITIAGSVLGTPAYMPPEQAAGETLDERADVFALGAILYQVLTGALPYDARDPDTLLAHVIAHKVVPIAERAPELPPELVTIVDRAMACEPADRYPSAAEFADELRRYQTGQLVGAHRYTMRELAWRWIRRHRAAVAVAGVLLVLLAAVSTLAVRSIIAERNAADRARQVAEERKRAAEKLVDYLVVNLRDELEPIGRLELLSGVGGRVQDYYRQLDNSSEGMTLDDRRRWSSALDIIGAAQIHQGDVDAALASYQKIRQLAETALERLPDDADWRHVLADAHIQIGGARQAKGELEAAVRQYGRGLEILRRLVAAQPDDTELALDLGEAHDSLGNALRGQSDLDAALAEYRAGLAIRERLGESAASDRVSFGRAVSHDKIGSVLQAQGKLEAALAEYRASLAIRDKLAGSAPQNVRYQEAVAKSRQLVGDLLGERAELDAALAEYQRALAIIDRLSKQDPDNASWRSELLDINDRIGVVLLAKGDLDGALERYHDALAIAERLTRLDPRNADWQLDLSRAHNRVGDAHRERGNTISALASYRAAKEIRKTLAERDKNNATWQRLLAWSHIKVGNTLLDRGTLDEALVEMQACRKIRTKLSRDAPSHTGLRHELASAEIAVGRILVAQKKPKDALEPLNSGIATLESLAAAEPGHSTWETYLAQAYTILADGLAVDGDRPGAAKRYRDGAALYEKLSQRAPDNASWQLNLAETYTKLALVVDDPVEGARLNRQAAEIRRALPEAMRKSGSTQAADMP